MQAAEVRTLLFHAGTIEMDFTKANQWLKVDPRAQTPTKLR